MGKRKTPAPPETQANSSMSSVDTTPKVREKRVKRKRYNSDDYILDDQDFLEKVEATPSVPSIMPQIVRTPKAAQKIAVTTPSPVSVKSEKASPTSSTKGRTPKKQIQTTPPSPATIAAKKVKTPLKSPIKPPLKSPVKIKLQMVTPIKAKLQVVTPIKVEVQTTPPVVSPVVLKTEPTPLVTTPTIIAKLDKDKKKDKKKKIKDPKKGKEKDSGTSSEEERWLDAIESGKLEEVDDELKKIKPKDPKFMTARQRAMYEKNTKEETTNPISQHLMSLPTGYKEKVLTAEAIQKAQIKSAKRKQLADEKREKDKRKTMERLLKKQDSKSVKQIKHRPTKLQIPRISYQQTVDNAKIVLPEGIDFPFAAQAPKDPPKPVLCSIPSCKNLKRYNCSKTNAPLCSFRCYKLNIEKVRKVIC